MSLVNTIQLEENSEKEQELYLTEIKQLLYNIMGIPKEFFIGCDYNTNLFIKRTKVKRL